MRGTAQADLMDQLNVTRYHLRNMSNEATLMRDEWRMNTQSLLGVVRENSSFISST